MSDSEIAYFLQLTKNELINKEKDNVQTRCNVVNREVNKTTRALVGANNMLDALARLKECAVYVDVKDYTQHIDEWKGLTIPYKAKQVPTSFKAYRKAAVNWANGRRASILAIKVFPQLIAQSVQYCAYVARALFPSDNNRAEAFFRLCEAAVILSILKSNVQLNQRSAETPLICQNSVIKHGFDKVLERYLPSENVPIIDIAASLLNEAPQEELTTHLIGGGVSVTTDYLVKAQKKMHQKLQSNMFGAFQKAFTDLYTSRLAQYRRLYMPTETSRTEQQPRASPSIVLQFNHWTEYIGQNLHLMPESEIHDLCRKVQQFQQSIENQITQRSFNNLQTMPLNPMNQYIIDEKAHNGYLGDCNSSASITSVPMSLPVPTHRYSSGYLENTTTIFPLMTLESKNENGINTIHTFQSQLNCNSNNNNNTSFCASPLYSSTVSAESEINVESTPNRKRKKSFDHYDGVSLMPNCKRARINHENDSDVFDTFVDTDSNES